jgi:DNA-binding beta-propeller fold protein YncE
MTTGVRPIGILILISMSVSIFGQEIVRAIPAPGPSSRGLATDGEFLWVADAETDSLYRLDPATGDVVHALSFEILDPFGGLALGENGGLWVSNGPTVYLLDPVTGVVDHSFGCPGG